jgi:peptidylprolyl isomerase
MTKWIKTAASALLLTLTGGSAAMAQDSNDRQIKLQLSTGGPIIIDLKPELAPDHVKRITKLAKQGFYDGLTFHRVIDGFMAQTGDPTGTGRGSSDLPDLKAEFSDYAYKRGTVGMARSSDPDSANSQFFICFTDYGCDALTGKYTVWGQVTEGMQYVDQLAQGQPPQNPDTIVGMEVVGQ